MNQTGKSWNLNLKIQLANPPLNHAFCLQQGKGAKAERLDYVEFLKKCQPDITFGLAVVAKRAKHGPEPDFFGPFVQGSSGQRFFYICVGTVNQQSDPIWVGRVKVPLVGINWKMIHDASNVNCCLTASYQASRFDGQPVLASIKLLDGGWVVQSN